MLKLYAILHRKNGRATDFCHSAGEPLAFRTANLAQHYIDHTSSFKTWSDAHAIHTYEPVELAGAFELDTRPVGCVQ